MNHEKKIPQSLMDNLTVFTAFKDNYELDITSTLKYVDFLLNHERIAYMSCHITGRYLQLDDKEIAKLNASIIKHVKYNSDANNCILSS